MRKKAFTLAEVLISLALLGIVAAFAIPKILQSGNSDTTNTAIANEAMGMLVEACQKMQKDGKMLNSSGPATFISYLNYVSLDPPGATMDAHEGAGGFPCDHGDGLYATDPSHTAWACVKLHSGAMLGYSNNDQFADPSLPANTVDTNPNHVTVFLLDPDGVNGGSTTGPSKSLDIAISTDCSYYIYSSIPVAGFSTGQKSGGVINYTTHPECVPTWLQW